MSEIPPIQEYTPSDNITTHFTGHDEAGQSVFIDQQKAHWVGFGSFAMSVPFISEFPPNLNDNEDIKKYKEKATSGKVGLVHPGGSVLRMVDFAPGVQGPMHRTKSLDYGIVVKGSLESVLDSGETKVLNVGDVCVQRGTNHAWRNTSDTEWARMVFVLLDCEPLVVNGQTLGEDFHGQKISIAPSGN